MQPASEWFREWFDSPYYHKLYFERNEQEAISFIERLLILLRPPPASRMLDVACGRGRHARILANQGYDVTGIDLAPSSIEYARQFRNDHLDFYIHDMRQIFCTNCFDYTFNFFTSFGYFRTLRDNDRVIKMVSLSLRKQGVFVLDYLNEHYAQQHLIHRSENVIDGVVYNITRWTDPTHFYKRIQIVDQHLKEPLEYTERIARFSLRDFDDTLTRGGLVLRNVFGSYSLEPFDIDRSRRLIIIAQKKMGPL
jgi:2-polyprenyl-3-methyl-5-hydroxy-6-metoxy-1,4-benzoquinol methylase